MILGREEVGSPTRLHVFQLSDSVSIVPFRLNYIDIRAALISIIHAREKEVLVSTKGPVT